MRRLAPGTAAVLLAGCAGGPPLHVNPDAADPPPSAETRPTRRSADEGIPVRVGLHWEKGTVRIHSSHGCRVESAEASARVPGGGVLTASVRHGDRVRLIGPGGRVLGEGRSAMRIVPEGGGDLSAAGRRVRGELSLSARAESLFVVNVLPLEEYLRGVVPLEIGPRPSGEREAVAAQAVAARTYTVKRLGQYGSLPFDLYASVQDQVYEGSTAENEVADRAIRETRGLVLADDDGLIEAYYSSTCGGRRSDIARVWPHRQPYPSLRGGPDGDAGREWCQASRHFSWTESWDGRTLSRLVWENVPVQLELPPGTVKGDLVDVRVTERGPSGRAATIEYVTTEGRWSVPGDRNRWILRLSDDRILRSVLVELDVERRGGRVSRVTARGKGNGHGVGMCQVGAIGRARAGYGFREILVAYYPDARIRTVGGEDLPGGRVGAS